MKNEKHKKKICFYSVLTYPLFNHGCTAVFGGAEIDLYNLARYLADKKGYEVTFVVGDYGQPEEEVYGNIRVRKLRYFNLDAFPKIRHKFFRQFVMWKEFFTLDSDIYITEAASEALGWMAFILKKLRGKKLVFRLAHDLDADLEGTREKGLKLSVLYKYGVYHTDYLISQTDRQQAMLKENMGLDSEVLKNGFFINEDIRFEDKKYILWVARAEGWKRPELLVEMAKEMPEQQFVMIMPGKNALQDRIRESIKGLDNIEFIDYVPFFEIQRYYDGAKLFVNTSEYEGFPNAFVQACLGKTPILSFNVNPDDFINGNRLGYFAGNDMEGAIGFIRTLDEEKLEFLGQNAFEYVKRNHDLSVIGQQYEQIIDRVAFQGKKSGMGAGTEMVE